MTEDDDFVSVGEPLYRVVRAMPLNDRSIEIEWENGRVATIDLASRAHRRLAPILATNDIFKSVKLDKLGWGIWWPGFEGAAIPSSLLYAWADGKSSEFAD